MARPPPTPLNCRLLRKKLFLLLPFHFLAYSCGSGQSTHFLVSIKKSYSPPSANAMKCFVTPTFTYIYVFTLQRLHKVKIFAYCTKYSFLLYFLNAYFIGFSNILKLQLAHKILFQSRTFIITLVKKVKKFLKKVKKTTC